MIMLLYAPVNYADQWTLDANVRQELGYDDNITMSSQPQGSMEYKLIPVINFAHKTETSDIQASASYGMQRYLAMQSFDSTLQNYKVLGNYATQRAHWGVTANMSIAPNRNTAIADSGNFASNSQRTTIGISPFVSYELTQLDSLKLLANYSKTTFSTSEFSNSQTNTIDAAWQRQWTERYSSSINISYSAFHSNNATSKTYTNSYTYSLNFNSTYLLSEQWKIMVSLGGRLTDTENGNIIGISKKQSEGFLSNTNLSYKGENLSGQLGFNRSLIPSTAGQLQEQTQAMLSLQYQITELLYAGMTANYQLTGQSASSSQKSSRENIIFQPSLTWQLSPDWTLSGEYRYRSQKITGLQDRQVESNSFMLTINYNWQGLSLSR